jgi:hypothetical protein
LTCAAASDAGCVILLAGAGIIKFGGSATGALIIECSTVKPRWTYTIGSSNDDTVINRDNG